MEIARLEAIIGGDIKPLQAALGEAKTELKAFAGQATEQTFKPLNAGLQTTVTTTKTAVSGFKQMVTEMKAVALIGLGAGIAAGLQALKPIVQDIITEIIHMGDVSKEVTEILKEQNEQFAKNLGNAQEELASVNALIAAAQNENLTREQRNSALKNAQELYPAYLNSLTLEKLGSEEAKDAIDQLTGALVRKAKAESVAGLISQTWAKIFELQNKPLKENVTLLDKIMSFQFGGQGAAAILEDKGLQNTAKTLKELGALLNAYTNQLNQITAEQAGAGDLIKDDDIKKLKKKKDEVVQILIDLNTNIKHISGKFIDEIAVETGNALEPVARTLERLASIKVEPVSTGVFERLNIKNLEKFNAQLKTMKDVASEIAGVFADMFTEFITKGRISFDQLAKSVERLISKLIEAVLQTFLLQAITAALTGGTSAAGFGLANFLKSGIHFADGGIITSPTTFGSASFAENGPEAVIPLDRLQNMVSGLGQNNLHITGELRAHGTDLVVALNRGNVRINRNYGSNFSN